MAYDKATLDQLRSIIPQMGKVTGITIRPKRREVPVERDEVMADKKGLEGDHFNSESDDKRAVTLIQKEHLEAVGSIMGVGVADQKLTRRNIVVEGINLLSLIDREFRIGGAVLQGTGECRPCSRMEENLGPGGYNAMRGHGGLTARVIKPGLIRKGDPVKAVS